MALTPTQQATLKAYINSEPDLNVFPTNSDGAYDIAWLLNREVVPAFVVYRKSVNTSEVGAAVSYVAVEAMTDINRTKITVFYSMNPQSFEPRADIRSYFSSTFNGALGGQGANTRAALEALWLRNATRVEKVFAVGTGTTVSPADMTFYGTISPSEVEAPRNLP